MGNTVTVIHYYIDIDLYRINKCTRIRNRQGKAAGAYLASCVALSRIGEDRETEEGSKAKELDFDSRRKTHATTPKNRRKKVRVERKGPVRPQPVIEEERGIHR
jgi:hypothetical protein